MKWSDLHKIGISGSRKFGCTDMITHFLDADIRKRFKHPDEVVIIHGSGDTGVDADVQAYCKLRGIKYLGIPARWLELPKRAGPMRNQYIVDMSNEVICFWDGESKGTKSTLLFAREKQTRLSKKNIAFNIRVFSKENLLRALGPAKKIEKDHIVRRGSSKTIRLGADKPHKPRKIKLGPNVTGKKLGKLKDLLKIAEF